MALASSIPARRDRPQPAPPRCAAGSAAGCPRPAASAARSASSASPISACRPWSSERKPSPASPEEEEAAASPASGCCAAASSSPAAAAAAAAAAALGRGLARDAVGVRRVEQAAPHVPLRPPRARAV